MKTTLSLTVITAVLFSGCGVAETAAVATAQGASAAEQAKQAKETEEKVMRDIEAAQKAAADARAKADASE